MQGNIGNIYARIQSSLVKLIPENWVNMPKKLIKAKPINCYEIPAKFGLNDELYNKGLSDLYNLIKMLHAYSVPKWTNINILMNEDFFVVEHNYNDLMHSRYTDEQRKSATVFNSAALEQKNKYEVFLGGNHPQINIKTTNLNKKSLLIFKDSYANALIQFLLPYYQTITIVDPRYYSDDIEKLLSDAQITDVLFLYNMNTFAEDNSLAGVLIDE